MASKSNPMSLSQYISVHTSTVAVYRWVIINGRQVRNIDPASGVDQGDDPSHGVWILKDTSRKDYTYLAHLKTSQTWTATFGCAYIDGDTLEALEILDISDSMRKHFGWKGEDASQMPDFYMILDIPSREEEGIMEEGARDDNGNYLLRFGINWLCHLDGCEGREPITEELWCAKKEVPDKQHTVLTDAAVIILKFGGKIDHADGEEALD